MRSLEEILEESSSRHKHLCPRQVLGARMALYASELLELDLPRNDKRLLVTAETDGCTVDGLIAATNCRLGSRTLRILDYGKVAATFTDIHTELSIRIIPQYDIRSIACKNMPTAKNKWEAMLWGYQSMSASELLHAQQIELNIAISEIISRPGVKTICRICKEEIINGREVYGDNNILCRACAGESYYHHPTKSYALQLDH